MAKRWAFFASLLFVSLTLVPGGAHLLALPNKIVMNAQDYLAAQQAYRGWAFAGALVVAAIISTASLAYCLRKSRAETIRALVALGCLLLTQVVFWTLNFPANQATEDWTHLPVNWERLRLEWEIGHAVSALLTLAALVALLLAFVRRDVRITSRTMKTYVGEAAR
jgi:hypothetical protein